MQNFFVAASDTVKPFIFGFQNPFSALLKSHGAAAAAQSGHDKLTTSGTLQRMARDVESTQPNLAAELRYFASNA